ncbi:MAG: HEAT repeat domain-containing protein, partial [Planctomycetota bacterium]
PVLAVSALLLPNEDRTPNRRLGRAVPVPEAAALPLARLHAAQDRPTGAGWLAGDLLRYRFRIDRQLKLVSAKSRATAPLDMSNRLEGALILRVYAKRPDGWTVGLELAEPRGWSASDRTGRTQRDSTFESLAGQEVVARLDAFGRFGKLAFPEGATSKARLCWKELLSQWRIVYPEDSSLDEWETLEHDTSGTYRARYGRRNGEGENPTVITKTKQEYTEIRSPGKAGGPKPTAIDGEVCFVLDPLPLRIDGQESLRMKIPAGGGRIESDLGFSFQRVAYEHSADLERLARVRAEYLSRAMGTTLADPESARRKMTPAEVKDAIREQLGELDRLLATGELRTQGALRVNARIIELVRESDVAAEAVMDRLRAASCSDHLASMLTACLGSGGTEAAQEGLLEVLGAPAATSTRRQTALFAMLAIEEPVSRLDQALTRFRAEHADLSGHALLVLGAIGHKVRESDRKRYERIEKLVLSEISEGAAEGARMAALQAVGNLGPEKVPAPVRDALGSAHPLVRSVAMHALRKIEDPEVERILTQGFLEDEFPHVRRTALKALIERHRKGLAATPAPLPLEELLAKAAQDPAEEIRELAKRARSQGL